MPRLLILNAIRRTPSQKAFHLRRRWQIRLQRRWHDRMKQVFPAFNSSFLWCNNRLRARFSALRALRFKAQRADHGSSPGWR